MLKESLVCLKAQSVIQKGEVGFVIVFQSGISRSLVSENKLDRINLLLCYKEATEAHRDIIDFGLLVYPMSPSLCFSADASEK